MRRIQTLVLVFSLFTSLMASPVKPPSAFRKAQSFVSGKKDTFHADKVSLAYISKNETLADDALFYVYNIGADNGFVIIAGDDRTAPVLGYSDHGAFSLEDMPENLRFWLDYYKEAMSQVVRKNIQGNAPQARPTDVIKPLLTTKWDQTWPYNLLCPMSGSTQCPTGCVATALAQVLNYHKFPVEQTNAIPSYHCHSLDRDMPALPATTIEWDKMMNSYNRNSSEESMMAVAKLMQYCGQAVEMDYSASSAGAQTYDLPWRISQYFKYPQTMHNVSHEGYSIAEWDSLIINELQTNGPVLYTAYTTAWEGHAFVCDGYDGDGLYHINWGWGGAADGYYRISVLDASSSGTGGSSTSLQFSIGQAAMLGLKTSGEDEFVAPEETLAFPTRPSLSSGRHLVRDSIGMAFPNFSIAGDFLPMASYGYFSFGFALYDDEGQFVEMLSSRSEYLWQGYSSSESYRIYNFGKNTENAHFTIRPVYKTRNGEWTLAKAADRHYIDVEVNGTDLYLTPYPKANFVVNKVSRSGQSVVVNLTNNDEEYNGMVYIRKLNSKGEIEDVAYEIVAIEPNSTRNISIYVDKEHSLNLENEVFYLSVDYFNNVYFYTNVYNQDAELSCGIDVLNLSEDKATIIGEKAICNVKLSNSGTGDYHHFFKLSLQDEEGNAAENVYQEILDLKAGESEMMTIELPIPEFESKYTVVATIYVDNDENALWKSESYEVAQGAIYWNAEGAMKTCLAQDVLTVPDDALAILLRNAYTSDVIPNGNPNTLYLLEKSVPNGLSGLNIVNSEMKTGHIRLTDGYDYYFPFELMATSSATYSRSFTSDDLGKWSTISLPFSPSKVLVDGKAVKWFTSPEDTGKSLWLQSVASVEEGKVQLQYVDEMKANQPYLIAIGEELAGKTLEFKAAKTTFAPSSEARSFSIVNGYSMIGLSSSTEVANGYVLHDDEFVFVGEPQQVDAFRVYVTVEGDPDYPSLEIIGPDISTAISPVGVEMTTVTSKVYDIHGREVSADGGLKGLPKGMYIMNGKKLVVK